MSALRLAFGPNRMIKEIYNGIRRRIGSLPYTTGNAAGSSTAGPGGGLFGFPGRRSG
jgi:hypothetical protein